MGLISTSLRRRLQVAAITFLSLAVTGLAPAWAQEQLQPQPAAAPAAGANQPFLVVTLGSLNKLTQDLDYVAAVAGQADMAMTAKMFTGMYASAVDMNQPIGVIVSLVQGAPEPVILLPTADVKTLLKMVEGQVGPSEELNDGTMVINAMGNNVYIRQSGNWAYLARNRDLFSTVPADPAGLFDGLGNNYNLAVRLRVQDVPVGLRDMLIGQIRQGFEQSMQQQGGDEGREIAENSLRQFEQLLDETDELMFGINVDSARKQLAIDTMATAVPGSKMAAMYAGQQAIPSQFASVIRPDAAMYYHGATSIGPETIDQTRDSLQGSIGMIKNALEQQADLSATDQEMVSKLVDRVADLTMNSVAEGKTDAGAVLLTGNGKLEFALGGFVADGNEAASIVKDLAKEVEGKPDAPRFMFDQQTYGGVTMHVVEADVPAEADEARKVFGDTLRVHIGTAPKAVYVALGDDSVPLLKSLIDGGKSDTGAAGRPLGQMRMTMMPILQYARSIESNEMMDQLIDALARSSDQGLVTFTTEKIENGADSKIRIGDGILQAIGVAAKAANDARMNNANQF
ncbi:MAG: hypothetical protein AAGA03_07190 [Planctomycetota bacterium]